MVSGCYIFVWFSIYCKKCQLVDHNDNADAHDDHATCAVCRYARHGVEQTGTQRQPCRMTSSKLDVESAAADDLDNPDQDSPADPNAGPSTAKLKEQSEHDPWRYLQRTYDADQRDWEHFTSAGLKPGNHTWVHRMMRGTSLHIMHVNFIMGLSQSPCAMGPWRCWQRAAGCCLGGRATAYGRAWLPGTPLHGGQVHLIFTPNTQENDQQQAIATL